MSLSLFTMSCAKSVAAPDVIEGTVGLEELTSTQLQSALQSIPPITDTTGVTFDFSQGYISPSSGYYSFSVNSSGFANASQANILTELKRVLNEYQGDVTFTPSPSWDSDTTSSYNRTLTVQITSSAYNVPSNLKTVKIQLYLMGGTWQ
ncbi:hypothetical protein Q5M87_10750 [Brachyspira innocens]|uniref:Uncharacterized protein n=1 Tax=Brachyspira innocens TaxID=13264 RepID=A0ABT8Z0E2_9SPIR|nr:hypothetical protein [Brachyspira innocens]MDO6994485.1 hypothetical protein [Brachyspira innocens]MDO7021606.1 hypothetical protein [Brachyspira innocens]